MTLSEDLNLELAWKKSKRNLEKNQKVFINNPYITDIIDGNKTEYLEMLSEEIDNGYSPSDSRLINFPKKDWKIRPASILKISDLVIYSALVIELYEDIKNKIEWSAQEQRFSRILLDDIDNTLWMVDSFKAWRAWKEKTRQLLDQYEYVVVSDIASYFESIEHRILYSHIESMHDNKEVCELLWECLHRWQRPKTRGLPQGYYPSNVLSELYLNTIDRRLESYGVHHARYSDDLNIYCDSKEEAIQSLKKLIELYREKGLVIQEKKTKILTSEEARKEFRDPNTKIEQIKTQTNDITTQDKGPNTKDEVNNQKGRAQIETSEENDEDRVPYTDGGKVGDTEAVEAEVLETAFEKHIVDAEDRDDGLFKFIVRKLGGIDNKYAVPYCMNQINVGGTQIRHILDKYFSKLDNQEELAEILVNMVSNNDLHYEFQKFAIIRWIFEHEITSKNIMGQMRSLLYDSQEIPQTKNYIIAYLGEYGSSTDIDMISSMYPESTEHIRKSVILMAIRSMEHDLRGTLYNQAKRDHLFCESSVDLAKKLPDG